MDTEPVYAFTIPSIHDDLPVSCRIYHPSGGDSSSSNANNGGFTKGAVIAHPYAPMGGSYDDHVVLAVTSRLRSEGFVVATFNFRGAHGSEGRSSWTGRPEQDDCVSIVGLLVYYLQHLNNSEGPETTRSRRMKSDTSASASTISLLLAGYSYGSLILARLPSLAQIINIFESAEHGSPAGEIVLRARTLASQSLAELSSSSQDDEEAETTRVPRSPVILGGEETPDSERRHSGDHHHHHHHHHHRHHSQHAHSHSRSPSGSHIRDLPHRIMKGSLHKRSSGSLSRVVLQQRHESQHVESISRLQPEIKISYLLISPVLLPLSTTLAPPGLSLPSTSTSFGLFSSHSSSRSSLIQADGGKISSSSESDLPRSHTHSHTHIQNHNHNKDTTKALSGFYALSAPTLIIFGGHDHFTSAKRLSLWAAKLKSDSESATEETKRRKKGKVEWTQIEDASHFWREKGTLKALLKRIAVWTREVDEESGSESEAVVAVQVDARNE